MNKIKELYKNISDEELNQAIIEIIQSEEDGVIASEGIVRKYAKLSGEITNSITTSDFYMTQVSLLKEAAYRWAAEK